MSAKARTRRVLEERLASEAAEREAAENAAAQTRAHEDARIEAERAAALDRQMEVVRLLLEELRQAREEAAVRVSSQECMLSDVTEEDEEEEEESRFPPGFRPRQLCRFLLSGRVCAFAGQCTFAHHESELHPNSW